MTPRGTDWSLAALVALLATALAALLDEAGARGGHVRVISHTGYRWSFSAEHGARSRPKDAAPREPMAP